MIARSLLACASIFGGYCHATAANPAEPVTALAYHPSGKTVVVGLPGRVLTFDANTGAPQGTVPDFPGRVTALAFDATGSALAIACGEPGKVGSAFVYRVSVEGIVGERIAAIPKAHADSIQGLALSPDGTKLASAGYDRLINLWPIDARKGGTIATAIEAPAKALKDHSDAVYSLAFHPDGRLLASASADRAVKVWDTETGERLYTLGESTDWVYAVAWSPDGSRIAAGGVDRSLRVWKANRNGGKLERSAFAHERAVLRVAYSTDGRSLFSAGEDKVVKAWDPDALKERAVLPPLAESLLSFAPSPDGKRVAVGRFDGVAEVLDAATGQLHTALLPAKSKPPKVGVATPGFAPRGRKTAVEFRGEGLDGIRSIACSVQGVTATLEAGPAGPTRLAATVAVSETAPVGPMQFTLVGPGGTSNPVSFFVDRYPAVPEVADTHDSARSAMPIAWPATVVGSIARAGECDYYRFEAKAGQEVGVQVLAAETGSILEPVLVLSDDGGRTLCEGTATAGFVAPRSGSYAIGLRDRDFRGGPNMAYRLHVGPIPIVAGAFPLGVARGRTTEVRLRGVNLGPADRLGVEVVVPADAAPGTKLPVTVPTTLLGEIPLGTPNVVVDEFPTALVGTERKVDLEAVPATADGVLAKPGDVHAVRFSARRAQRLIVEVNARRLGSPLDSTIEIVDGAGRQVPRAILRSTARTYSTLRDHSAEMPGIRLETWGDLKIDDYLYADGELMRIFEMPRNPDDDCLFYQLGGRRLGYLGTTPCAHPFAGTLYRVELHPPGSAFSPNGMPQFSIQYRNDDGGPGYGADSMIAFEAPADGVYVVRVTDSRGAGGPEFAYRLTVRAPRPDFAVKFSPLAPAVWKGGGVPIAVTATRADGFDAPIRVSLEGLPPGLRAPATFVEGHLATANFVLSADANATWPAAMPPLKLVARATVDGREVVREAVGKAVKLSEGADVIARVGQAEVAIRPGSETRFTVEVERRNGFAGRVPIEVRGLPHGVRVLDVGLSGVLVLPRDTGREVVLYAEPWVRPMERPFAVVAKHEAKKLEHAAPSVSLKVER